VLLESIGGAFYKLFSNVWREAIAIMEDPAFHGDDVHASKGAREISSHPRSKMRLSRAARFAGPVGHEKPDKELHGSLIGQGRKAGCRHRL
jgi:hypothetical protein